jgi:hypothetical protein
MARPLISSARIRSRRFLLTGVFLLTRVSPWFAQDWQAPRLRLEPRTQWLTTCFEELSHPRKLAPRKRPARVHSK